MIRWTRWGFVVVVALVGCDVFGLTGPAGFRSFAFERQFAFVAPHPAVVHLSIERQGDDDYLLQFTQLFPDPATGCCHRRVESQPRLLTDAERDAVLDAFRRVRWEGEADTETCPLWDPAYIDVFRWDEFTVSTNLCQDPYLTHERAERLREVLFGLTAGSP